MAVSLRHLREVADDLYTARNFSDATLVSDAIAEISALRSAADGARVGAGWRPIEEVEESNETMLLYHPPVKSGRAMMPRMISVGRPWDKPMRPPTYWMPLPADPVKALVGAEADLPAPAP